MNRYCRKVGVVGAGCYGTAIAHCFSSVAEKVILLSDIQKICDDINLRHTNILLGDITLRENISCTMSYNDIKDVDILFIATPVSAVYSICSILKENKIESPLVLCSKGLDTEKVRLISEGVNDILSNEIAIFSGPSFAHEIVNDLSAGVNVASKNRKLSFAISKELSSSTFVIKPIDDYIGLQIAGAFKNILAVGCGIINKLKYGNSAVSKLIVDGIEEMIRLAIAMGGKKDTFLELGGIGDIVLTCTSDKSRNVLFGKHIASNKNSIENWSGNLAEGAFSARAVPLFEKKYMLEMPTFHWVHDFIYNK